MIVVVVFGITTRYGFIAFDDPYYVAENPVVIKGLTVAGAKWALTTSDYFYWHPLTWLSHMLDVELFGLDPHGHHLTNVVIHTITTLLVFWCFFALTERIWRSAIVAALFAIHPLHVEPVAWIAERKELLAGMFWFAGMLMYATYARRGSWLRYAAVMACFALALASKPVAVTFPFVLLLLDVWPLRRWNPASARVLIVEKMPLVALSIASSVITYVGQSKAGAMTLLDDVAFGDRFKTALTSYAIYLKSSVWPGVMAPLYPYDRNISFAAAAGAAIPLGAITLLVMQRRSRSPYLMVGWLWFIGTLVPMIGIVQVGAQSRADRFMYLPIVGLFVMAVWSVAEWLERHRYDRAIPVALTAIALVTSGVVARAQTRYWSDSITLLQHTVGVTDGNATAWHNLGVAQAAEGKLTDAVSSYRRSLQLRRQNPLGHYNLGLVLEALNRNEEAAAAYAEAVRRHANYGEAHFGLGAMLLQLNRLDEARAELEIAIKQLTDEEYLAQAHFRLGLIGAFQNDMERARNEFRETLKLRPSMTEARINLQKAEGR